MHKLNLKFCGKIRHFWVFFFFFNKFTFILKKRHNPTRMKSSFYRLRCFFFSNVAKLKSPFRKGIILRKYFFFRETKGGLFWEHYKEQHNMKVNYENDVFSFFLSDWLFFFPSKEISLYSGIYLFFFPLPFFSVWPEYSLVLVRVQHAPEALNGATFGTVITAPLNASVFH